MDAGNSQTLLLGIQGATWLCVGALLLIYNLVAVVKYLREDSEESASGLAWAAFVLGLLSITPACGCFLAAIPWGIASYERSRIYKGDASLRGAGLTRAGGLTAVIILVMGILQIAISIISTLMASSAAA